ncbi:DNA methyltransferase [Helicobacter suis]|uniref:DNA methyltransferase n=1 Tax=Helicobacter suis TaxID=104628 RepID=UPI001F07A662|nr:DNA methyltransferase [Helicobacter suis]
MNNPTKKSKSLFEPLTIEFIKKLGVEKSDVNLYLLIELFKKDGVEIGIKREIVSSIGRQKDNGAIFAFLNQEVFKGWGVDIVCQMLRTCLYKAKQDSRFVALRDKILKHYDNEVMHKMVAYHEFRQNKHSLKKQSSQIKRPTLLVGDNRLTLNKIGQGQIQLVFTSPPYYNARTYSSYKNYKEYLKQMQESLAQAYRILEEGRFIIINVFPVIVKRAGREFESIRYPIHFDFHSILVQSGFYFVDEIIWIKPEVCVPNRIAGYLQTKRALSYKPNCITESLLVYRKNVAKNLLLSRSNPPASVPPSYGIFLVISMPFVLICLSLHIWSSQRQPQSSGGVWLSQNGCFLGKQTLSKAKCRAALSRRL